MVKHSNTFDYLGSPIVLRVEKVIIPNDSVEVDLGVDIYLFQVSIAIIQIKFSFYIYYGRLCTLVICLR